MGVFVDMVMEPGSSGTLSDTAGRVATTQGFSAAAGGMPSQDWASDFGPRSTDEFQAAVRAIEALVTQRCASGGAVRLLCHCMPLRCHCTVLAERLAASCSAANSVSAAFRQPTSE